LRRDQEELSWRVGGPQGSGIDRVATLLGRACMAAGLHVFTRREYHSNIIGRHSYLDLQIGTQPVGCHREFPQVLVSFEAEALCRHLEAVVDDGVVVYGAQDETTELNSLQFLDARLKDHLQRSLAEAQLPATAAGLLQRAEQRGVKLFPIALTELIEQLGTDSEVGRRRAARAINTVAVAASAALTGLPQDALLRSVRTVFKTDVPTVALNENAVRCAYEHVAQRYGSVTARPWLQGRTVDAETICLNGSQSVALGKLAGGLGMQTYYPISPATDESSYLEAQDDDERGAPLVVQVEDELAAITMACGAALTGARAATATSGPGFCLMSEGLGWAGMNEVPVVISLYQRGGPSTGMPTRTEQGDLLFAIHAGHGEFPRLVIASGDIQDCFYDAMQAFDYAERYQLPVVHLLDKALASSSQTLARFPYRDRRIDRGARMEYLGPDSAAPQRFALTESGMSPRPLVGQAHAQHWMSGAEHGSDGRVSEDPEVREQMMDKRAHKLDQAAREIPLAEKLSIHGDDAAALTVLTWGSSKGAVLAATRRLNEEGIAVRAIVLRLLWPFPATELNALLSDVERLVVVECNHSGQFNLLLTQCTGRGADHSLVKYNGRPIGSDSLYLALKGVYAGGAAPRLVLSNDYD